MALLEWKTPKPPPSAFHRLHPHNHPYAIQYLWNRGYSNTDYVNALFHGTILHNTDPMIMKDMHKATERIWQAIDSQELICVYGDYDADGITGVGVMYTGLLELGANIMRYNPNRKYGYGANPERIESLLKKHPDIKLFVSVDNGIKATSAVNKSVEMGVPFIVTDHHTVDYSDFPDKAYAVINPQQDECPYPEPSLSGVGVAYKVIHGMALKAIEQERKVDGWNLESKDDAFNFAEELIDMVAVGTIADMMPLSALENRSLVRRGLDRIKQRPRMGLHALAYHPLRGRYPIDLTKISAMDVGFGIGPCFNATGRLEDPTISVDLLLEENESTAKDFAGNIIKVNNRRKEVQKRYTELVLERLEKVDMSLEAMPIVIVTIDDCPGGVVGLIAGNLTQKFNRPSAVLRQSGKTDDGEIIWTASARSVVGFDITSALKESAKHLGKFGGHSAAAGFSINDSEIEPFKRSMAKIVEREMGKDDREGQVDADFDVPLPYINRPAYEALELLQPFGGTDMPLPKFIVRELIPVEYETWSASKAHLRGKLADGKGTSMRFNGWNFAEWKENMPDKVDVAVTLTMDNWGSYDGKQYMRFALEAMKPAQSVARLHPIKPKELRQKMKLGKRRL